MLINSNKEGKMGQHCKFVDCHFKTSFKSSSMSLKLEKFQIAAVLLLFKQSDNLINKTLSEIKNSTLLHSFLKSHRSEAINSLELL